MKKWKKAQLRGDHSGSSSGSGSDCDETGGTEALSTGKAPAVARRRPPAAGEPPPPAPATDTYPDGCADAGGGEGDEAGAAAAAGGCGDLVDSFCHLHVVYERAGFAPAGGLRDFARTRRSAHMRFPPNFGCLLPPH